MNATRKLTLAMALALTSSNALALGLGQIKVKSGLNEPLLAVIPVLIDDPDELRGLSAALASREAFSRVGLNFSRLAVPLEFEIVKRADGSAVIKVSTDGPVAEPAVSFLLEVNWANGKLLREYSVLLDPPTIAPAVVTQRAEPTPARTPTVAAPRPTTAAAPAPLPAPTQPMAVEPRVTEPVPADALVAESTSSTPMRGEYTVRSGDTLWDIANAASGNRAVSITRMMVALQRANPDAFFRDNINALKSGAVMRIPGEDELAQVRAADARAEVRRQNQAWADANAAQPTLVARTGGTDSAPAPRTSSIGDADHLQLAAPGESGDGGENRAGVEGGTGTAIVAELKQDIARSKEALASEQQRSSELQARVQALEDLKNKNGSLLNLKNTEIAQLQEQLRQAQARVAAASAEAAEAARAAEAAEAAKLAQVPAAPASAAELRDDIFAGGEPAASALATASAASIAVAVPTTTSIAVASAASAVRPADALASTASVAVEPDLSATPAVTEPAPSSAPVVVQDEPGPSTATPWYMQTWARWLGGALLILILLGALFASRRSKSQSGLAEDYDGGYDPVDDSTEQSDEEYALLDEIEQHPDDLALHLELVSLYYALRDQNKFESAAESMYAQVDDPQQAEWQQVLAMGEELCPDHPLFADLHTDSGHEQAADVHQQAADSDDELDEFDAAETDTELESEPPTAVPEASDEDRAEQSRAEQSRPEQGRAEQGYNFDFDLTPAQQARRESTGDVATGTDEFDLDNESEPTLSELASDGAEGSVDDSGFSSDPVDTKLDLARAYHDMGDAEGARAMLEEVIAEGSQSQQDAARNLLQELD